MYQCMLQTYTVHYILIISDNKIESTELTDNKKVHANLEKVPLKNEKKGTTDSPQTMRHDIVAITGMEKNGKERIGVVIDILIKGFILLLFFCRGWVGGWGSGGGCGFFYRTSIVNNSMQYNAKFKTM